VAESVSLFPFFPSAARAEKANKLPLSSSPSTTAGNVENANKEYKSFFLPPPLWRRSRDVPLPFPLHSLSELSACGCPLQLSARILTFSYEEDLSRLVSCIPCPGAVRQVPGAFFLIYLRPLSFLPRPSSPNKDTLLPAMHNGRMTNPRSPVGSAPHFPFLQSGNQDGDLFPPFSPPSPPCKLPRTAPFSMLPAISRGRISIYPFPLIKRLIVLSLPSPPSSSLKTRRTRIPLPGAPGWV